jgi:tetratricopeptide (TPR) repeat protein
MAANGNNTEGVRMYQQGNYTGAIMKFNQALSNDPNNPDAYYNLAATYHQLGKLQKDANSLKLAENLYSQCLSRDRNHTDCYRGLAALYVETGREQQAFTMLQQWAGSSPHVADARIELARLYEEFGQTEPARQQLYEALAIAPNDARAWAALGHQREKAGDHAQALANYRRAQAANSSHVGVAGRIAALQQNMVGGWTAAGNTQTVTQPTPTAR